MPGTPSDGAPEGAVDRPAHDILEKDERRRLVVHGETTLTREELDTMLEMWDRVQITDPKTGEVLHDGL